MTFDLWTLKLVCKSSLNLPSKFGHARPLGSQLFDMYATDGQTDGQKQRLLPLPYGCGGIQIIMPRHCRETARYSVFGHMRVVETERKNTTAWTALIHDQKTPNVGQLSR